VLPLQAAPAPAATAPALAKEHLKAGRHADAEKSLEEFLHQQPNSPDAAECHYLLAKAQLGQKRDEDALSTFSGLVRRHPQTEWAAKAMEEQALFHIERRNPKAAQQLRDDLLVRHPNSPTTAKVWSGVADDYFEKHEYAKALAIYQRIEKCLSAESLNRLKTARILADSGDTGKILAVAEKALNEDDRKLATELLTLLAKSPKASKDLPRIHTKLGWCLMLEGTEENQRRAEQLWRGVIRSSNPSDPWYAESKWHLVQLHSGPKNDWKQAVAICDSIIKEQTAGKQPHEQAMFAKAWLLTVHDQGAAAVAAFDELGAAYPTKMKHPPIIRHRERALKSAANQSSKKQ